MTLLAFALVTQFPLSFTPFPGSGYPIQVWDLLDARTAVVARPVGAAEVVFRDIESSRNGQTTPGVEFGLQEFEVVDAIPPSSGKISVLVPLALVPKQGARPLQPLLPTQNYALLLRRRGDGGRVKLVARDYGLKSPARWDLVASAGPEETAVAVVPIRSKRLEPATTPASAFVRTVVADSSDDEAQHLAKMAFLDSLGDPDGEPGFSAIRSDLAASLPSAANAVPHEWRARLAAIGLRWNFSGSSQVMLAALSALIASPDALSKPIDERLHRHARLTRDPSLDDIPDEALVPMVMQARSPAVARYLLSQLVDPIPLHLQRQVLPLMDRENLELRSMIYGLLAHWNGRQDLMPRPGSVRRPDGTYYEIIEGEPALKSYWKSRYGVGE
jgi:hypothetical protein